MGKWSIYLLVFLLPIFFLPWTANVLDFNKQALLLFLVFISFFSWLLKSLFDGKVRISLNFLNIPVLVLLAVLAIATLLSGWRYGSFWGWPLNIADSFITILSFVLLYFLVINLFEKDEIFWLLLTLVFSSFLAVLFGIFQLFGKFIFPFSFSKSRSFNTIGTTNSIGIFAAIFLPLMTSLFFISKKWIKILLSIFGLSALVLVVLLNFWPAWLSLLIAMVVVLTFGISKRESFHMNWLIVPIFILVLAISFGFFRVSIPGLPAAPLEISLSQRGTLGVAGRTLTSRGPESFFFGSGPSTFVYDYSKFKPKTINQTAFWGVRFSSGASEFLDSLATTGILGLISFLSILAIFFWIGARWLVKKTDVNNSFWVFELGIFSSLSAAMTAFFFYPTNLSMSFLFWIFMPSFIVLAGDKKKDWELKSSSLANVLFSFLFSLFLIFGIIIFFMEGQRYIGEVRHLQGIRAWQRGDNQKAITYVSSAISHTGGKIDNYLRDLSQLYLFKINQEVNKKNVSKKELKQVVPSLVRNVINLSKLSTDVNPINVANWSVRGFVYRQMTNVSKGADQWAIKCYKKANELEPNNPYIITEIGRVYLSEDKKDKAMEEFKKAVAVKPDYAPARYQMVFTYTLEKKIPDAIKEMENIKRQNPNDVGAAFQLGLLYYNVKKYDKAKAELKRAVAINQNYSNARYFLGLIYDKEGEKNKAISQFEKVEKLNPKNKQVKKILANLRAGKPALEGVTPSKPPIEKKPAEVLKK